MKAVTAHLKPLPVPASFEEDRALLHEKLGYRLCPVEGGGSCIFRSISHQFWQTQVHYEFLRRVAVAQFKSHPDMYKRALTNKVYESVLKGCQTRDCPVPLVTCHAIADVFEVEFIVLSSYLLNPVAFFKPLDPKTAIRRVFYLSATKRRIDSRIGHCDSLFPIHENVKPLLIPEKTKIWLEEHKLMMLEDTRLFPSRSLMLGRSDDRRSSRGLDDDRSSRGRDDRRNLMGRVDDRNSRGRDDRRYSRSGDREEDYRRDEREHNRLEDRYNRSRDREEDYWRDERDYIYDRNLMGLDDDRSSRGRDDRRNLMGRVDDRNSRGRDDLRYSRSGDREEDYRRDEQEHNRLEDRYNRSGDREEDYWRDERGYRSSRGDDRKRYIDDKNDRKRRRLKRGTTDLG